MRHLWVVAVIMAMALAITMVTIDDTDAADAEGTSTAYDGTTYKFIRYSVPTYYCKMTDFDAGTDTFLRVQSRLEGYPVNIMGDGVLSNSSDVTVFTIPAEVEKMGSKMFEGCTSLEEIIFLGKMPEFAADTFDDIDPDVKVKYLDRYSESWSGFSQLDKSVLPVYTSESSDCSFEYCELDGSITILRHIKGSKILIPSELKAGDVTLPVKYIGDSAFFYDEKSEQDKIVSVTISEGVYQIGVAAFKYCEYMETLTLPSSLIIIYDEAFRMPIDTVNWNRGALKSLTLPEGLEYIGFEAFRMNYNLKTITVPDSVTHYGDGAFRVCAGAETITIGNGVTSLGESSFDNCLSLKEINIPDSVLSIGPDCFSGDRSLVSITIPNSVISIGATAFTGCTSLSEISMSDATALGNNCFYNTGLITLRITDASIADGVIDTYMNNGGWILPGMATDSKISLLIIDTEDEISVDITGTTSGFVRLTDKAVNTVGGIYTDGTNELTGAERAGKTYAHSAGKWTVTDVGTLTVLSSDTKLGTVNIRGGTFVVGSTRTFIAQPKLYCNFVGWSDGEKSATYTVTITSDKTLIAKFEQAETRTVSLSVDPLGSGTTSGGGKYVLGSTAKLTATPNQNYNFIGWSDGNTEPSREIKVTKDMSLTASFGNITITFDTNGGSVPVGPLYSNDGWKLVLPGSPEQKDGQTIVAWEISGVRYDVGSEYEVHGPVTAKAIWSSNSDSASFPWIIIAVVAIVIVAIGVVVWKIKSNTKEREK